MVTRFLRAFSESDPRWEDNGRPRRRDRATRRRDREGFMDDAQAVEIIDDIAISPPGAAVLEFVTDLNEESDDKSRLTYITSKQSFLWAALASLIARHPNWG